MKNEVIEDILRIYSESKEEKNKQKKHSKIQREICKLAKKYGFVGEIEFGCNYIPKGKDEERNGKIDVVWKYKGKVIIAIEIDSSPRSKSVLKLCNLNCERIWLYYGKDKDKFILTTNNFDEKKEIIYITPELDIF